MKNPQKTIIIFVCSKSFQFFLHNNLIIFPPTIKSRTYTLSSFIWTLINTQLTQDIFFVSQKIENEHLKRRKYWHLCKLLTVSIFIKTFLFSLLYDVCDFFLFVFIVKMIFCTSHEERNFRSEWAILLPRT